jgi:hypothetical protein
MSKELPYALKMGQNSEKRKKVIMTSFNNSIHRAEKAAHFVYGIMAKKQSPNTADMLSWGLKMEFEHEGRYPVWITPDADDEFRTIEWSDGTKEDFNTFLDYVYSRRVIPISDEEWNRIPSYTDIANNIINQVEA